MVLIASNGCFLVWFGCTFGQNPALNSSVESFDQFGFHKQLLNGLAQLNYKRPTAIQVLHCCQLSLACSHA